MSVPVHNNQTMPFFEIPHQTCSECDNPMSIFTCHGCCKAFCLVHANKHRDPLIAQLKELRHKNEALQTDVDNASHQNRSQNLIKQINDWEIQSIAKIKQAADEARKRVLNVTNGNGQSQLQQLVECRKAFSTRLKQAETYNDFHERHLEYWNQFLEDLKQNFSKLQATYTRIEYCTVPFISKIIVHESSAIFSFTKWCHYQRNWAQFTDIKRSGCTQQQLYVSSNTMEACEGFYPQNYDQVSEPISSLYASISLDNTTVLHTGKYAFHLNNACHFIGIISRSADTERDSLNTPSVYGWTGDNCVYLNGVPERDYHGYRSDMQIGDTIVLVVNCEQKVIRLINTTSNRTHELAIDVKKCPLPWLVRIRFAGQD